MGSSQIGQNKFLVFGRAGMDIYADPPGSTVETATKFHACLGGSAGNIAAGIARLGGIASLISAVSDDAVGRFVTNALDSFGIEWNNVARVGGEFRTSLAATETRIENTQNVIYRNNAADFQISTEQVDGIEYSDFGALIVTGTALAMEPSRSAVFASIKLAREAGITVLLDIDFRPYSWTSAELASETYRQATLECDIVIGNDEEFQVLAGTGRDGLKFAAELAESSGIVVIYKMGENGSITYTGREGSFATGIYPVSALKPMGAGDAFMAAFASSLASDKSLEESVQAGAAAAAIVVSSFGCAPAMPDRKKLEEFMVKSEMRNQ